MRACVCACVHVCGHVTVCVCACVFQYYVCIGECYFLKDKIEVKK